MNPLGGVLLGGLLTFFVQFFLEHKRRLADKQNHLLVLDIELRLLETAIRGIHESAQRNQFREEIFAYFRTKWDATSRVQRAVNRIHRFLTWTANDRGWERALSKKGRKEMVLLVDEVEETMDDITRIDRDDTRLEVEAGDRATKIINRMVVGAGLSDGIEQRFIDRLPTTLNRIGIIRETLRESFEELSLVEDTAV